MDSIHQKINTIKNYKKNLKEFLFVKTNNDGVKEVLLTRFTRSITTKTLKNMIIKIKFLWWNQLMYIIQMIELILKLMILVG